MTAGMLLLVILAALNIGALADHNSRSGLRLRSENATILMGSDGDVVIRREQAKLRLQAGEAIDLFAPTINIRGRPLEQYIQEIITSTILKIAAGSGWGSRGSGSSGLSEEEEAMWDAAFEVCPMWGQYGHSVCPDGPASCKRDPTVEDIKVLCTEYMSHESCNGNPLARAYLGPVCSFTGSGSGIFSPGSGSNFDVPNSFQKMYKACPKLDEIRQKLCPNDDEQCKRDPNEAEISMICKEFKENKQCGADDLAKIHLPQVCRAGSGSGMKPVVDGRGSGSGSSGLSEEEAAMWDAAFEVCPTWGQYGHSVCPDGPASCKRDPTVEEIKVLCTEYKSHDCNGNPLASAYLGPMCSLPGSGSGIFPPITGSRSDKDASSEIPTCDEIKTEVDRVFVFLNQNPTDVIRVMTEFCPKWPVVSAVLQNCPPNTIDTAVRDLADQMCSTK